MLISNDRESSVNNIVIAIVLVKFWKKNGTRGCSNLTKTSTYFPISQEYM
jgi:hypothetical protein